MGIFEVEAVRGLTGGRGMDYAFEVIGQPATIRQSHDCLCKKGIAIVLKGFCWDEPSPTLRDRPYLNGKVAPMVNP